MKTVATRYALPLRALHWATVAVIAVVYLVAEFRGYLPREGGQRALAMQWHMFLGLFVLLLVLPRIGLRLVQPAPPILPPPARLLRWAALATHLLLYAFLIAQPVLGLITAQSAERAVAIPMTDWALPALVGRDPGLHETAEELHEWLGTAFYFVIGLHAAAALWHHFAVRDNTLRRMV
ncbi:cytochrome b [Tahibacter harae]|uniref:Cytochrome b n=1 Tax=Tahibacter harae TaxID=2963937 RepID=A0ABT1QTL8_9GAMM|nr:cytochrome b [Tahibacter harae]MCQ4165630.1 cytochrome b [Tahibacter harae]